MWNPGRFEIASNLLTGLTSDDDMHVFGERMKNPSDIDTLATGLSAFARSGFGLLGFKACDVARVVEASICRKRDDQLAGPRRRVSSLEIGDPFAAAIVGQGGAALDRGSSPKTRVISQLYGGRVGSPRPG